MPDYQEAVRLYQQYQHYLHLTRVERNPIKNMESTEKCMGLLSELEKKFDRETINKIMRGEINFRAN